MSFPYYIDLPAKKYERKKVESQIKLIILIDNALLIVK